MEPNTLNLDPDPEVPFASRSRAIFYINFERKKISLKNIFFKLQNMDPIDIGILSTGCSNYKKYSFAILNVLVSFVKNDSEFTRQEFILPLFMNARQLRNTARNNTSKFLQIVKFKYCYV